MKKHEEWRSYKLWLRDQTIEFKYNIITGEVRAPGIVEFTANSLEDARTILKSAYQKDD